MITQLQCPWEATSYSVSQSPHFFKPKGSLPCSQEPATGPYSEPDKSNPEYKWLLNDNMD